MQNKGPKKKSENSKSKKNFKPHGNKELNDEDLNKAIEEEIQKMNLEQLQDFLDSQKDLLNSSPELMKLLLFRQMLLLKEEAKTQKQQKAKSNSIVQQTYVSTVSIQPTATHRITQQEEIKSQEPKTTKRQITEEKVHYCDETQLPAVSKGDSESASIAIHIKAKLLDLLVCSNHTRFI